MSIENMSLEFQQKIHSDIWRLLELGDFPLGTKGEEFPSLNAFRMLLSNRIMDQGQDPMKIEYDLDD